MKNLKIPISLKFKSLEECDEINELDKIPFDENMKIHDFMKISNPEFLHLAF